MSNKYNPEDAPSGEFHDDSYAKMGGSEGPVPVQSDNAKVEDPIDSRTADSDAQLARDEDEAIDQSNILRGGRTRHAKPRQQYREPGDEEGMPPPDDGTSATDSTANVLRK
ncbi:hypothetical protein VTK73DRAFT_2787 [Phialemonium thermophilum]|uniref:Histone chaperone domain-containing protein n=1 Tax=Phialemonium thermophilum TaxID=223376 RepID=A0ABR3VR76_9PEZI